MTMADNYLEKRMEDYRAGKLAPKAHRCVTVTQRRNPNDFVLSFPQLRVLILGGALPLVGALVRSFRRVGCSVALCNTDIKASTSIAQSEGARYYPFDPLDAGRREQVLTDLARRWGGVDVVVDLNETAGDFESGIDADEASLSDRLSDFADLIVLHSHPRFSFITETAVEI